MTLSYYIVHLGVIIAAMSNTVAIYFAARSLTVVEMKLQFLSDIIVESVLEKESIKFAEKLIQGDSNDQEVRS